MLFELVEILDQCIISLNMGTMPKPKVLFISLILSLKMPCGKVQKSTLAAFLISHFENKVLLRGREHTLAIKIKEEDLREMIQNCLAMVD